MHFQANAVAVNTGVETDGLHASQHECAGHAHRDTAETTQWAEGKGVYVEHASARTRTVPDLVRGAWCRRERVVRATDLRVLQLCMEVYGQPHHHGVAQHVNAEESTRDFF